ncbi:MAG: ATP-binding protein [Anaerolineae bacterium]
MYLSGGSSDAFRQARFAEGGRGGYSGYRPRSTSERGSRIFDQFYRLEQRRPGREGLGLGLAIAKEIVEAHSGKIWAESQPGQGAKFILSLPLL